MNFLRSYPTIKILSLSLACAFFLSFAGAQNVQNLGNDVVLAENLEPNSAVVENAEVVSVKLDGEISVSQTYIIERAIEAAKGKDALLIEMDTPGGDLNSTLKIIEKISGFKGRTICYVNSNAVSAGAIIAGACDEIWFSPSGVMGAAEAVNSDGSDLNESLKRKIKSFMSAKVRSFCNERRAQVLAAMVFPEGRLVSKEGAIIKNDGELLSLTSKEACEKVDGASLLGNGTESNVESVLEKSLGSKNFKVENIDFTPLEKLSKLITKWSSIILGIGFFLLFVEFKTPNFGIVGTLGAICVLVVLFGAHVAGLAGYEGAIFFAIGLILVALELMFFPGTMVLAGIGGLLMFGAIAWALAGMSLEYDMSKNLEFAGWGILKVLVGIVIAALLIALLGKFLPKTSLWKKMVLENGSGQKEKFSAVMYVDEKLSKFVGLSGVAATPIAPSGKVEVGGNLIDASSDGSVINPGDKVKILGFDPFGLKVKKESQTS